MPNSPDSSGLISLAALHDEEKRRSAKRAEAARRRAESEQRARQEAERERARARAEEERQIAARRQIEESKEPTEETRLRTAWQEESARARDLARIAEESRLNADAERSARLRAELSLTSNRLGQRRASILAMALLLFSWLGAAGLYWGALRPSAARALDEARETALREQRARISAQAESVGLAQQNHGLSVRIATLLDEFAESKAHGLTPKPPLASGSQKTSRTPEFKPAKPCRDDGDPLNPCLRR